MNASYARIRILQAIARTGTPPTRTRKDFLARMQDAGLISPLDDKAEPWFVTKRGMSELRKAENEEACRLLTAACDRILA